MNPIMKTQMEKRKAQHEVKAGIMLWFIRIGVSKKQKYLFAGHQDGDYCVLGSYIGVRQFTETTAQGGIRGL